MDYRYLFFTLFSLVQLAVCAKGQNVINCLNVTVDIWDGEVTAYWNAPKWAQPDTNYEVQVKRFGRYTGMPVPNCSPTPKTRCDVSELINTTTHIFNVQVRVSGQNPSNWSNARVNLREGKLLPPIFSLSGNSSSLSVMIKTKPALSKIFTSGLNYHVYLKEKGSNKVVQSKMLNWPSDEWRSDVQFNFLQSGQEYCVTCEVEDKGRNFRSEQYPEQCYVLSKPEWYSFMVLGFVVLSILGGLVLLALFLCYFLRRKEKLPIMLKSPRSGWHPLTMGEVPVEIVTDKGFLLLSMTADEKIQRVQKMVGTEKDARRRGSMDSGVSMDQQSSEMDGERTGEAEQRQKEDSGCGSLVEAEGSAGRAELTGMSTLDEKNQTWSRAQQNKGTVMVEQSQYGDASSLEVENCRLVPEMGVFVNYTCRSQGPSSLEAQTKTPGDTECSVAVAVGYRPSQLACVCSGQGLCLWCRVGSNHGSDTEENTRSVPDCLTKDDLTCKYNTTNLSSQYRTSSPLCFQGKNPNATSSQNTGFLEREDLSFQTLVLPTESIECVPLLQCAPQLTVQDNGVDNSMNTFTGLSLHDMELTFG